MAQEQKELTRRRIRRAAMEIVARRGFDATVDEIAESSGVSARTIFRHYSTHAALIVATVKDIFAACGRRPIEGLPSPQESLDGWLEGLARTVHRRNWELLGEAFWDLHATNRLRSEPFVELVALRRKYRLSGVQAVARLAWETAGGVGEPPEVLTLTFGLNLSAFATQALLIDFDRSPDEVAEVTAHALKTCLRQCLAEAAPQANGVPRAN